MEKSLLIIGCSHKKIRNECLVSAWDLYDGINYRILKKLSKNLKLPNNIDILILSAKYGFLKPNSMIEYYDQIMTPIRAKKLRNESLSYLKHILTNNIYDEIFINMGYNYLIAIDGFENLLQSQTKIICAKGRIGEKASQMKKWINAKIIQV